MTTWTEARSGRAAMRRVASMPSTRGMRMSISSTSGAHLSASQHGLLAVGGLADHLEVVLGVEQRGEPGPDQFLVVGQRDPDHRSPSSCESPRSGSRARTVKPPPGRGPA